LQKGNINMPSTISAGTSAGTALNLTSDTTGNLAFQTNNGVTALSIDTNQNVTFANNVTYTGTITATAGFSGNGAGLTAINASNVTSGTLASARLPTSGVNASSITAGTLAVAQGGTGASTLTANNVLLGNGTSALQVVAPGTNGNILTSNGTTWVSSAPAGGGVTSLNGDTGALKGMTLLSTTSFTSATTIDITGIPTTAGTTYLLQIVAQTPNNGGLSQTKFSLRYSTNNGSTFATTAIMSSMPNYNASSPYASCIQGYMGDVFWTIQNNLSYTTSVFANMFIRNGVSNGYPSAYSTSLAGDFENLDGYGSFYTGYQGDQDTNWFMSSGGGTVRNATFNALRIIRRSGDQVVTGVAKLFVLGV
jgi:hypothetical protein